MANELILVVDDDQGLLTLMKVRLQAAGYRVALAKQASDALARAQDELYDLAIVDLKMAGADGITLLQNLRRIQPGLPVMILTAHGTIASAVEATKKGAYDYLTKPFDAKDMLHRIAKALEVRRLQVEVDQLRSLVEERCHFDNVIATSDSMQRVLHQVRQVAVTDATVSLYGESGTGKELIAKSIHLASPRSAGPFVAINCGALPEGLLKGAYTGADRSQRGLLQQADGGTLFLDEIAEIPPALQVKFLRVLQEREVTPLGAEKSTKVDFRLIAATNQDLWQAVGEGRFREDLYYRIHVIPLNLPPLRERSEDIPLLARHFMQHFSQAVDKDLQGFSPEALQHLMLYEWPGNIRELMNVIERAVILATDSLITSDLLLLGSEQAKRSSAELLSLKEAREDFDRAYLVQVLTITRGNVSRAAALSGKYRGDFYKLLRKHGLEPGVFKNVPPTS
jgi:two-component system response regulator GlrR